MKTHQATIGKNDEWLTPPDLINKLGDFDLDPCSPVVRPWDTALKHYNINDDGLALPWHGRVWLNPPFNRNLRRAWMEKMAKHGNGIMLIPAATETKSFNEFVWNEANSICFLSYRPHSHYVGGERACFNCGTAIVLCAYGKNNTLSLIESQLGKTLIINN